MIKLHSIRKSFKTSGKSLKSCRRKKLHKISMILKSRKLWKLITCQDLDFNLFLSKDPILLWLGLLHQISNRQESHLLKIFLTSKIWKSRKISTSAVSWPRNKLHWNMAWDPFQGPKRTRAQRLKIIKNSSFCNKKTKDSDNR